MAKNLNDVITINHNMTKDEIDNLLEQGKTLLLTGNKGEMVTASLAKGYSDYFEANIELAAEGWYQGVCSCGQPNNIKLYLWRD